jgi:hypothetical protein
MERLANIIKGVDWQHSAHEFGAATAINAGIEKACHMLAVWNAELSFQDIDNPALPFLQEMKSSAFYVPACAALGLNKPAASSMRAAVENALYFSYFRDHEIELRTLTVSAKYYVSKREVVEYHLAHTSRFKQLQGSLNFTERLERWYSGISAIIHGQIPGVWSTATLAQTEFDVRAAGLLLTEFKEAAWLVNGLFLLTTHEDIWEGMNPIARKLFLKGVTAAQRNALGLATT